MFIYNRIKRFIFVGSLGIYDDVITLWDRSLKNKVAAAAILKNNWGGGS